MRELILGGARSVKRARGGRCAVPAGGGTHASRILVALFALVTGVCAAAGASPAKPAVTDSSGAQVALDEPARRIVSLAPHATELLFAAGAGPYVVGAVAHSDHPPQARAIARVGHSQGLDLEAILALRPDLIVAWESGNPRHQVRRLRALGLAVYVSEPRTLEDIPAAIERLGVLAGTESTARAAGAGFREALQGLGARYGGQRPVRVFYQVWHRPLVTVSGEQIITEVLHLCGGENVFAELETLAPQIGIEAVLAADPEAIVASGADETRPEWLDDWQRWPQLTAVRRGNLFFVPPDLLQRPTPRLLDGAAMLCQQLEEARGR
jgi:iron complex transport system substrate-binding protein